MLRVLHKLCRLVPALLAVVGTASVVKGEVKVETVTYHGWHDSIRISNGTVEVIAVPSLGRIMHYGFIGGPNLIWEDHAFSGQPVDPAKFPRFGGNKAWPWPQDEWPNYIGHDWPPPPSADQAEFVVSKRDFGGITLKSPVLAGFGLFIERDIHLDPMETRVTLITRLTLTGGAPVRSSRPVGAWSITPAAAPETLLVNLTPASDLPVRYKPLGSFEPFASLTTEDGILRVVRNPDKSSKVGVDGDAIGAVYGNTLWLLTANRITSNASDEHYVPGERVQIYANADSPEDLAHGLPPYMELEVTSPRKALAKAGDSVTLTETWQLRTLGKGEDVMRAFRQAVGGPRL